MSLLTRSGPTRQSGRGQGVCKLLHLFNPLLTLHRIARTAGQQVLRSNGVVRGYTNWGAFLLPRPTTKHQTQHHQGHYFIMRFDSSAETQQEIRRTLGLDPRMIRHSVVKIGERLGGKQGALEDITGKVTWNDSQETGVAQLLKHSGIDRFSTATGKRN